MAIFISYLVARTCLGSMLVASGAAKLANGTDFANTLKSLGIVARREQIRLLLAITFSSVELLIGGCILAGIWSIAMNALLLVIMFFFSFFVLFALYKAPYTKCRCFGALSSSQFDKRALIRNIIFTGVALFAFVASLHFPPLHEVVWMSITLLVGYALFAFGVVQATKTEYLMKESVLA